MPTKKSGFVHSGISNQKDENYSPIYGYQDLPLLSLKEAVQNVAIYDSRFDDYAKKAIRSCNKDTTNLTLNESAAIYLYTMQTAFNSKLNDVLRVGNRGELKQWFAYLKLLINALGKLPSMETIVWRGVASDISQNFFKFYEETWWTVNSCSKNLKVVEFYLGGMGTIFGIETIHGKDISEYSAFPDEQEVILMPGTHVRVKCQPLEVRDRPYVISLEEW